MNKEHPRTALRLPVQMTHFPTLRAFLEESARAFGITAEDGSHLSLAGEEIFSHVCELEPEGGEMEVDIHPAGHQLRVGFLFRGEHFDPWAFNIGARVSMDDDASLEGLGLLLASRLVDRFTIRPRPDGRIELVMIKEKRYPETPPEKPEHPFQTDRWRVCSATPETARLFVARLRNAYRDDAFPDFLRSAGRVIDMVAGGEYGLVVALDARDEVMGGALWQVITERTIESFGPYLFEKGAADCAQELMDALIGRIAKSKAVCLITRWLTPETPKGTFEVLGHLRRRTSAANETETPVCCRFLQEDAGCQVWTVPELTPFLDGEYTRLCMARELVTAREEGERRANHSVFSARLDRQLNSAALNTVLDGSDAEPNLCRQVAALEAEGFNSILFELDLATARNAMLAPVLIRNGFVPRLVMPYAGQRDVVVFQRNPGR